MSAYTDICKQRCEGCRKLIPMLNRPWSPIRKHRFEYCDDPDDDFLCTAPTQDQVIEEQKAELDALRSSSPVATLLEL